MKGKVQIEAVSSSVLKGNPLSDPHRREIPVYLPPSYGKKRGKPYPVIYYLAGFTGGGRSVLNYNPWKENLAERLDRLIARGKVRECVLIIPDCFTAFGGSQYVNSSAVGRYEDHVVKELVPYFEDKLHLRRGPEGRAVMGKSSGGYGALSLGMKYPEVFGHALCHSGDMLFERCYGMDIPKFINCLDQRGGSAARLVREFLKSKRKDLLDHAAVNILAMAACYSPNPRSPWGFDFPFDTRTGELIPKTWARWREKDPVEAAQRFRANLKKLKTLYFDCGRRDEFCLHLGARKLSRVLKGLGVRHTYEEHDLGHFDMAERHDRSFQLLLGATP
ncbi:MAG: esterase [Elusimicrobia bacterium]|nr:esterase [Elusimicrobiota bacterium]